MTLAPKHPLSPHWLGWLAAVAILALAAALRLWALGRPDTLVFDELYYVRDAVSQLAHGYPTDWPDDDPAFGGERARAFSNEASTIAHPPLGKWLIGLGILLFGPDSGLGWRISVALAGVATVGVTMRIGWLLTRSMWVACLAGLLLAIDGVHIVLSRVALLDGLLTFFVVLGALFVVRDWGVRHVRSEIYVQPEEFGISSPHEHRSPKECNRIRWRRPWLFAAGLAFGAAAAIKWSGLYPLAAFLVLITVADLLIRIRDKDRRPWFRAFVQGLVTAAITLPAAFLVYLASWIGWTITPGGEGREPGEAWWVSLWQWHAHSLSWHSTLDAEHPFQSHPLTWPLALRPTSMHRANLEGYVSAITPIPNPLVTWAGVAALLLLVWVVVRALLTAVRTRSLMHLGGGSIWVCVFILTGYLSGWLPWMLTFSRSAVFQFYAVVLTPFAALALALVFVGLTSLPGAEGLFTRAGISLDRSAPAIQGRRISVAIFIGAALVIAVLFWPTWAGMPVIDWFHQLHRWLPGWV